MRSRNVDGNFLRTRHSSNLSHDDEILVRKSCLQAGDFLPRLVKRHLWNDRSARGIAGAFPPEYRIVCCHDVPPHPLRLCKFGTRTREVTA